MARAGIKGYHFLLTGAKKIPDYDADKQKKDISALKLLNFTVYNNLILAQ